MKLTTLALVFVLAAVAVATTGCGKDMKVSIKPAESEKDAPSSALVRKVEVSYHDPKGQEQVRESVPVLGLAQSVSMRADLLKNVSIEKDGVFEARAYSSDGLLLLRGQAQADPDSSDGVEIVLDRQAARASELGSPLLRRIRLADAALPTEFVREARDLRAEMDSQRCLELPALTINGAAGSHPKIILEAAIKSPSFSIEVGMALGREALKQVGSRLPVSINPSGEAEIELGRRFLEGALLKHPARLLLRIHSDRYEGCLEVKTHPAIEPATANFMFDRGVGVWPNQRQLLALGILDIGNPNEASIFVRVRGVASRPGRSEAIQACFHQSNDPKSFERLACVDTIDDLREVPPHEHIGIAIFGAFSHEGFINRQLQVNWTVMTGLTNDEQAMVTPVSPSLIP